MDPPSKGLTVSVSGRSDLATIDATKVGETKKGVRLDFGGKEPAWFPKSQVEDNGDGTWSMPEWLAMEKGAV